ncbi:hypothetical protein HPB48_008171 [Haemaphysalis longicornis]|uniref:Uncharacterized protein n=1 Tax=Haemaphysalis longicornis TaxID=44386 RepID=A0A9J6H1Q2_HAELO|nr:hypothetical protein HPB48_008171 [Haemaphysalis longicornis]
MWKCSDITTNPKEQTTHLLNILHDVQWEAALPSSTSEHQQVLHRKARGAADSHGVGKAFARRKTKDKTFLLDDESFKKRSREKRKTTRQQDDRYSQMKFNHEKRRTYNFPVTRSHNREFDEISCGQA